MLIFVGAGARNIATAVMSPTRGLVNANKIGFTRTDSGTSAEEKHLSSHHGSSITSRHEKSLCFSPMLFGGAQCKCVPDKHLPIQHDHSSHPRVCRHCQQHRPGSALRRWPSTVRLLTRRLKKNSAPSIPSISGVSAQICIANPLVVQLDITFDCN